jgi:glycosylphosphatidylinositol transamidase
MAQSSSSATAGSSNPFPPLPSFNPARLRSYVLRLPLFTRLCAVAIFAFWVLELQSAWEVIKWGSLIPKEIGFGSMYRLNTFPFIHLGFIHMAVDLVCFVPLLERFEAEHGTLNSLALFMGRESHPLAEEIRCGSDYG